MNTGIKREQPTFANQHFHLSSLLLTTEFGTCEFDESSVSCFVFFAFGKYSVWDPAFGDGTIMLAMVQPMASTDCAVK